jgi:hypothetical protein
LSSGAAAEGVAVLAADVFAVDERRAESFFSASPTPSIHRFEEGVAFLSNGNRARGRGRFAGDRGDTRRRLEHFDATRGARP